MLMTKRGIIYEGTENEIITIDWITLTNLDFIFNLWRYVEAVQDLEAHCLLNMIDTETIT